MSKMRHSREERLFTYLIDRGRVVAPVLSPRGTIIYGEPAHAEEILWGEVPRVPARTVLLPGPVEQWRFRDDRFSPPEEPPSIALVGLPPCELAGISLLDQLLAEDTLYQAQRGRTFLVGATCTRSRECTCTFREFPLADLWLVGDLISAGSRAGEECAADLDLDLTDLAEQSNDLLPPQREIGLPAPPPPGELEELAKRCLGCGACSAVCPTCYCYDCRDRTELDGTVIRERFPDSCQFRNHALVAGGENFRPTQLERLKMRIEHKRSSFRHPAGIDSCTGCGRCVEVCPVGIDLRPWIREVDNARID